MLSMNNVKGPQALLNDGILLSALTLLGYFVTSSYEQGYLTYHSIPAAFARTDASNVIITTCLLLPLALSCMWGIRTGYQSGCDRWAEKRDQIQRADRRKTKKRIHLPLMMVLTVLSLIFLTLSWRPLGISMAAFCGAVAAFGLIEKFKGKSNTIESDSSDDWLILAGKIAPNLTQLVLIILAFMGIAYGMGSLVAKNTKEYLVFEYGNRDAVIIRIYENQMIGMYLDASGKKLCRDFFLINLEADTKIQGVRLENIYATNTKAAACD